MAWSSALKSREIERELVGRSREVVRRRTTREGIEVNRGAFTHTSQEPLCFGIEINQGRVAGLTLTRSIISCSKSSESTS